MIRGSGATEGGERIGGLAVVRSIAALRRQVAAWQAAGDAVALVPTMGALHAGHLALVAHAGARCSRTVASLFVNPTQFAPSEDFERYPRDEAGDAAKLAAAGCDLLYAPPLAEIYPPGFATTVTAGAIAEGLEGRFRPSHFAGVATVVAKLLLQSRVDLAVFGEKDYQQLQVIRRVTRDLDIATRIDGVPTVREPDGLALSSRNVYLSAAERAASPALHRALRTAARRIAAGEAEIGAAVTEGLEALARAGFGPVDYLAACDAETLQPIDRLEREGRLLAAAWLGRTRLIDNLALTPSRRRSEGGTGG